MLPALCAGLAHGQITTTETGGEAGQVYSLCLCMRECVLVFVCVRVRAYLHAYVRMPAHHCLQYVLWLGANAVSCHAYGSTVHYQKIPKDKIPKDRMTICSTISIAICLIARLKARVLFGEGNRSRSRGRDRGKERDAKHHASLQANGGRHR